MNHLRNQLRWPKKRGVLRENNIRTNLARRQRLLLHSDSSIAEIGYRVGFKDLGIQPCFFGAMRNARPLSAGTVFVKNTSNSARNTSS